MSTARVDVHHHFLPDYYRDALVKAGITRPDGMAKIPDWSEGEAIAALDRLGIGTAMLSISSPGVNFGDQATARHLARRTNEDGARLREAHAGRFGFFAATPLPDVAGALDEIAYAFDTLGADGVVFETNFKGAYLGDDMLKPVYEELDRRRAVVFIHPTGPHCQCSMPGPFGGAKRAINLGYPTPLIEFLFETTRTVTQMMLSGTLARYPDIRLVVPHAGAALPVLAGRIELQMNAGGGVDKDAPKDVRAAMRRLYYDMAGSPVPELLGALLQIADPAKLLYGSDWPFTPIHNCAKLLRDLEGTPLFDDAGRRAMMADNARRLFPVRLAKAEPA